MVFITVLILVTLSIAGSAAFFSIYGLAQIFSGAFWPVVIMAGSLEAGKLVAASYAYRYWNKMNIFMLGYLLLAILVLMSITSAGIFGFLSSAYQQDILPIKLQQQKLALLEKEKTELTALKSERLERKQQIDADIAALPNNYVTGRQRLMKSYGPEIAQLRKDISDYTTEIRAKTLQISDIKNKVTQAEVHVGPIVFIASAFNKDVDDATKWLILLIIFAFDPLAIVLTIGVNKALLERTYSREQTQSSSSLLDAFDGITFEVSTDDDSGDDEDDEEEGIGSEEVEIFTEPEPSVNDVSQLGPDHQEQKTQPKARVVKEETQPIPRMIEEPIAPRPRSASTKLYKPHSYHE